MTALRNLSRRTFLELSGAGAAAFVIGVQLPGCAHPKEVSAASFTPNVFITLDSGGDVTIVANRAEMGQGIRTGLSMIVADEMEADRTRVTVRQSDGTPQYGDQATDGSKSIRMYYTTMRDAGATCRMMLEQAAADRWGAPPSECSAVFHEVRHLPTGRSLSFGELADAASKLPVPAPDSVRLKDSADFRYIGKELSLVDLPDIVSGRAVYGADPVVPGVVIAVLARSPVTGGRVRSFDDTEARKIRGVLDVVRLEGAAQPAGFMNKESVAVIAENTWAAIQGRDRLVIEWDDPPGTGYGSRAIRKVERTSAWISPAILDRRNSCSATTISNSWW